MTTPQTLELKYRLPQRREIYPYDFRPRREWRKGRILSRRCRCLALHYEIFPLGVRAGKHHGGLVEGVNLGGLHRAKIERAETGGAGRPCPLCSRTNAALPLNKLNLAVGDLPEVLEKEPNNSIAQAQAVSFPMTINGHIDGGAKPGESRDEDYFRFQSQQGTAADD